MDGSLEADESVGREREGKKKDRTYERYLRSFTWGAEGNTRSNPTRSRSPIDKSEKRGDLEVK